MRIVAAFAGALVLCALCLIALFAAGGPAVDIATLSRQAPLLGRSGFIGVLTALGAGLLTSLCALVIGVVRRRKRLFRGSGGPMQSSRLLALLAAGLAVGVIFTVILAFLVSFMPTPDDTPEGGPQGEDGELENLEQAREEVLEEEEPVFTTRHRRPLGPLLLWVAGVLGGGVVLYLAVRYARTVRRAGVLQEEDALRELARDLARSARIGLEEIMGEPDHRRAVIAAYARMEEVFAKHGFPPEAHQTPTEFIQAVLEAVAGLPRAPLLDLTRRYETAKFSLHQITSVDRERALTSLRRIEAGLGSTGG